MGHLDKNIAINLKRIRKSKNMSLDMLAEQTGVSKSMLGQIERGESNPTVATIGKIVEGIRVSFDDLIQPPKEPISIVEKGDLVKEIENNCRVYMIFPYDERRNFEVYLIEIEPGGKYKIPSRGEKTFEYVVVNEGELTVEIDGKEYVVKEHNSLQFAADQEHCFSNKTNKMLYLHVLLHWDSLFVTRLNHYIGA